MNILNPIIEELPDFLDVNILRLLFVKNTDNEDMMSDKNKCSKCGGYCCKSMGCHISPFDLISIDKDDIKKLLNTGFVSIDWWDNFEQDDYYGPGYYLRMRNKNSNIVDPAYIGICSILTQAGCALEFQYRPKGGRSLSPYFCNNPNATEEEHEEKTYTKYKCVLEWHKYHNILKELVDELQEQNNKY